MSSFLERVAKHILDIHGTRLAEVHIVVPTRRAVFFLKREFGIALDSPVLSPEISSIEDFVTEVSGLETTDPVNLLFTLFEAFQEVDDKVDFNRFLGWGSVLMSDFDRMDMAMVRPDYLFSYLTEARAMERWNGEGAYARTTEPTTGTRHFFSLFENIRKVYDKFRERLQKVGLAYPGMAYRYLAENLSLLDNPSGKHFYFAGFNAFTSSEHEIIRYLTKSGRGNVLWDTDAYYMTTNPYLEAGRYMRRLRENHTLGAEWNWMTDDLLKQPREINTYGVPNATLQTRVANQIYQTLRKRESGGGLTAIVLADENLLTPMLYALDESVSEVNVTMGLPLRNSMIFTLVDAIFELQQHILSQTLKVPRYNHRYIVKLFTHPFLRHYARIRSQQSGNNFVETVLADIRTENRVYLTLENLKKVSGNDPLVLALMNPWPDNDPEVIINRLYETIDLLSEVYKESKSPAEQEYLYLFYTLLGKFNQTLKDRKNGLNLSTVRQLLFELLRQNKIPFSGEPISELQIIGLLETRALDFDNVIILSVNEGILPAKKRQNTLIPLDIAREVGLPTYEHQEALSAYYFYRLLQRSKEVHLLYVNTTDALGGGEKSRFLLQLEYEWPRFNSRVNVINHSVEWEGPELDTQPLELVKDERVLQRLLDYLKNRGIYPTHIHTLLNSPLDFYLKHVLRMEEVKDTEETLGMDKLGSWLHNSFEQLDHEFFLKRTEPGKEDIDRVLADQFRELGGYETETGLNSLYFKVGSQQFHEFMKAQHLKEGHRWPVATEQNLSASFEMVYDGRVIPVKIGGKIDRVELAEDGNLFVMDYKTGSVEVKSPNTLSKDIEGYLTTDTDYKMNYVRQLWLYQYLVYREMSKPGGWRLGSQVFTLNSHRVKSGFYSLRAVGKVTENPLVLTATGDPIAYMRETERILGIIVSALLNEEEPFRRGEV